jgi:hypothetical protein
MPIFWGVTPCELLSRYQRHEETNILHFQTQRLRQYVLRNAGIYLQVHTIL